MARAILIHPDLVIMWKEIGYFEICNDDVNELVMQGALLILFPPTPPDDWEHPSVNAVVSRLRQLTDFSLNSGQLILTLHLSEYK